MKNRTTLGWALVLFSTVACGGAKSTSAPATDPGAASTTSASTTMAPNNAVKVTIVGGTQAEQTEFEGVALGIYHPASRGFHVLVFDADTDPKPTCETLKSGDMKKGGMLDLVVAGELATGKLPFLSGAAQRIDPDGKTVAIGMVANGIGADVKSVDDKSFSLELTSTDSLKPLSGSVTGTICPEGAPGSGTLKTMTVRSWIPAGDGASSDASGATTAAAQETTTGASDDPTTDKKGKKGAKKKK